MEKNCSTCKHSPVDEHCKGCKGEKDGNTHWELEKLDFSAPKKVVGNLISADVLDKIVEEIEIEKQGCLFSKEYDPWWNGKEYGFSEALEIIDKYRKEYE